MPRGGSGRNSYNRKSEIIVNHIVDERGRVIEPHEFCTIMTNPDFFLDRYDDRRLALALMFNTGLRAYDAINAKMSWFKFITPDNCIMQMSQCKPAHIKSKDGKIHLKTQPRFVPLSNWLSFDLYCYIRYRIVAGAMVGLKCDEFPLFPKLTKARMHMVFKTWRDSLGKKYPWLNEVWRMEIGYNEDKVKIWERKIFRVSCHAGRASYCTNAYLSCDKDIKAAQVLSGHTKIDNLQRYVKVFGLEKKKEDLRDRYINPLCSKQPTPLLVGQKTLREF